MGRSEQSGSDTLQFSGQDLFSPTCTIAHQDGRAAATLHEPDLPAPPSTEILQDARAPPYTPQHHGTFPQLYASELQDAPPPPDIAACQDHASGTHLGQSLPTEPVQEQPVQVQQYEEATGGLVPQGSAILSGAVHSQQDGNSEEADEDEYADDDLDEYEDEDEEDEEEDSEEGSGSNTSNSEAES